MIKLSVLILTHNRPKLFDRCIKSVIDNCDLNEIEIIVNNDSDDIKEDYDFVSYFYNHLELTQIYKFLVSKVTGKYIYFLEDDDYLSKDFYSKIKKYLDLDYDEIIGKYYSCDRTESPKDTNTTSKDVLLRLSHIRKNFDVEDSMLQLGQCIFKRDLFKNFEWFSDNDIHNDYKLIKHFYKNHILLNKIFFIQTCDGYDNISFPEFNGKGIIQK